MFGELRRSVLFHPFHGLAYVVGLCNPALTCRAIFDGSLRGLLLTCARVLALVLATALLVFFLCPNSAVAQVGDYEGRPISSVEVVLEGTPADAAAQSEFKSLLRVAPGAEYSA